LVEYLNTKENKNVLKSIRFSGGRIICKCDNCKEKKIFTGNDDSFDQLYIVALSNKTSLQHRVDETFYQSKSLAVNCQCIWKGAQTETMEYSTFPEVVLIRTSPSLQNFDGKIVLPNNKIYEMVAMELNFSGHSTALVNLKKCWYWCNDGDVTSLHRNEVFRKIKDVDPKGDALFCLPKG